MAYYLGIDCGGTYIKGGIVDETGKIYVKDKIPTEVKKGTGKIIENIATLAITLAEKLGISISSVKGMGIGIPGIMDEKKGVVIRAYNLNLFDAQIIKPLEERLKIKVSISNDANCATLGEGLFGSGKGENSVILITLGTGVGGGVLINKKLLETNLTQGLELGHIVIKANGRKCSCGLKGCFEAYSSATALVKEGKKQAKKNKNSLLYLESDNGKNITSELIFALAKKDDTAKNVIDDYIKHLSIGLTSLANVFRPNSIILSGGISAQGENLILPLQRRLDNQIFGGSASVRVIIKEATLKNDAGLLGAAALNM